MAGDTDLNTFIKYKTLKMRYRIFPDDAYGAALEAVHDEILKCKRKYIESFNSTHEGYAVLKEEVDEMWDDIKKNRVRESVCEAIQVAAMAIRYIAEIGEEYPFDGSHISNVENDVQKSVQSKIVKINEGDVGGSISVTNYFDIFSPHDSPTGLSKDNVPSGI